MAFDAGAIVSNLQLDKTGWNKSVTGVEKDTQKMGGFFAKSSAKMKSMGKTMTIAGGSIVASLGLMIGKFTQTGDWIDKMSKRTGFSATALSELAHAADISGADLNTLEKGVKKMSKSLVDADLGLETYTRSFDRLGLSVEDLMKMSPEEQFEKIGEAMAEMESPTLRAATAQEIFGRAGTQLLPLFAEGKKGMKKLREEAHTLGIVFDEEAAAKAAKLKDEQTRLTSSLKGVGNSISLTLIPILTNFITKITGTVTKITDWIKEHPKLSRWIVKIVAGIGGLLTVLGPLMIMLPGLALMFGAITAPVALIVAAIAGLAALTVLVVKNWKPIKAWFIKLWSDIKIGVEKVIKKLVSIITAPYKLVFNIYKKLVTTVINIFKSLITKMKQIPILKELIKPFEKAYKLIKSIIQGVVNWVKNKINSLKTTLSKIPLLGKLVKGVKDDTKEVEKEFKGMVHVVTKENTALAKSMLPAIKQTDIFKKASSLLGDKLKNVFKPSAKAAREETDDLGESFEDAKEKAKTFIDYLAEKGILTLEQKRAKIEELQGFLKGLEQAYNDGEISVDDYTAATLAAKEEMDLLRGITESLSEQMKLTQEALATVNEEFWKTDVVGGNVGGTLADVVGGGLAAVIGKAETLGDETLPELKTGFETFSEVAVTETEEIGDTWTDVSQRIKDKWITRLGEMLRGGKLFKKDLKKKVWNLVKEQFTDMISSMVTKWTNKLLKKLVDFTFDSLFKKDGILDNFKGMFKDLVSMAKDKIGKAGIAGATLIGAFVAFAAYVTIKLVPHVVSALKAIGMALGLIASEAYMGDVIKKTQLWNQALQNVFDAYGRIIKIMKDSLKYTPPKLPGGGSGGSRIRPPSPAQSGFHGFAKGPILIEPNISEWVDVYSRREMAKGEHLRGVSSGGGVTININAPLVAPTGRLTRTELERAGEEMFRIVKRQARRKGVVLV